MSTRKSSQPIDAASDAATVERIWGTRIAGLEGGYGDVYNAERQVDARLLARALAGERPGLALDVGTFYPDTPKHLAQRGWSVVCADLSEQVCRRVRQLAIDEALPLRAVRCDAALLPFRRETFDLVTDCATAVVTPQPDAVVGEELRVLKRAGRYVLVTSNRWTRSARKNVRRQRAAGGRHPRWGYFNPVSPWALWRLARAHRLSLIAMDSEVHGFRAVGPVLALVHHIVPPLRRFCGWRLGAAYAAPAARKPEFSRSMEGLC